MVFDILSSLSIKNSLGTQKWTYWYEKVWIQVGQGIFCVKKTISIPARYRYGFSSFSLYNFSLEIQRESISRSPMITRVHGAPDQYNRCDTSDTKAAVKAKFTTTKNHIYTFKV